MRTVAKLLLHSVNSGGVELLTWELEYWRSIHAEIMTHRAFSRNAGSSRAVPIDRMISDVEADCAGPVHWGSNKAGMQAGAELPDPAREIAERRWRNAARLAIERARQLQDIECHKQIVNRVLEPFMHMKTLVTCTGPALKHFFALRAHPDAQPEFQVLAYRMLAAYLQSTPKLVAPGDWHLPFDPGGPLTEDRIKICVARCARVSYLTFGGNLDPDQDLALYDKLSLSDPMHASAFEHCARASHVPESKLSNFDTGSHPRISSDWFQYRKTLVGEFRPDLDLNEIFARKPDWVTLGGDSPEAL